MATITEDYVSYETAKLLKEKGFLKGVDLRTTQNLSFYDNIGLTHNLNKYYDTLIQDKIDFVVAPSQAVAMKWLREKYCLHFVIQPMMSMPSCELKWAADTYDTSIFYKELSEFKCVAGTELCDSPEEAVEAALKYCLENLI